nr:A/G-specific adenine glycosylase [Acuticoccus mangrovi]
MSWYDRHRRALPWRVVEGRADPYRVWLSEIMLQQTTVAAVIPYFERFTRRWPTVVDLAGAEDGDVMAAWAGLGYYARARNLLACARAVAARGAFPTTREGLRALPGVGDYTSAAIAAIAFGETAVVVDGNVERVVARLLALPVPPKSARREVEASVAAMLTERAGDFAQAMMDLGATICTPRNPVCALCPIAEPCAARTEGEPTRYPVKAEKKPRKVWQGVAFVPVRSDGTILTRRRPERGLLGGMSEAWGSPWGDAPADPFAHAPFGAPWRPAGGVTHVFTHATLTLDVFVAEVGEGAATPTGGTWQAPAAAGLPTLMKKVVERALGALG